MKKTDKHTIEMLPEEYAALISNSMIMSACDALLASPRRRSGYVLLSLTEAQLEDLTGWVAAEANHAKTRREEEALGEVWENLDSVLFGVKMRRKR